MSVSLKYKSNLIRLAALIAVFGNAILAIAKVVVGFLAHSSAMIGDGVDSGTDVLIGIISLFVIRIIDKPADSEHPWGHGRAETIATSFLSFTIFFMGAQLVLNSLGMLFAKGQPAIPSPLALLVTLISIGGKLFLAYTQFTLGKRAQSSMVLANAKNMASDVLISLSVLVGLILSLWTKSSLPDTILAILLGLWIIKTAVGIFLENSRELMDGNRDQKLYQKIFDAVQAVPGASNPHRARMRQIAGYWDIDLDIEVDGKMSVREAHRIATAVEKKIRERLENVYDVMVHVEPKGDRTPEEYGISENDL